MRARRAGRWAPSALVGLLLIGCVPGPSPDPGIVVSGQVPVPSAPPTTTVDRPEGPGGPGQPRADLSWQDCGRSVDAPAEGIVAECGSIRVPLNRAEPRSNVHLSLLRLSTEATPNDAWPLVAVLDEPGRIPVERADLLAEQVSRSLLDARPVVFLDRRGSGDSAGLDCLYSDTEGTLRGLPARPDSDAEIELLQDTARQVAFDCGDLADPHLPRFNSVAAADDLDSLRASLELPTLDLLGRGDGATLGAIYLERYPGRAGLVVLDGPSDPRLPAGERAAAQSVVLERALDRFAAACTADDCPLGEDPRATVVDLVRRLEERPGRSTWSVTGGSVLELLRLELATPAAWPDLAAALAAADDGDVDPLLERLLAATGDRWTMAASLVTTCNDTPLRLSGPELRAAADEAAAQAPVFGPYLVGRLGLCAGWPAPEAVASGQVSATLAPVVFVRGTDDPLSPADEVAGLATQVAGSVTINRRSTQHGNYPGSDCVRQAVDLFLTEGAAPTDGLMCPP